MSAETNARAAATPATDARSEPRPDPGPASPCSNVCRMNPQTGLCEGCLRSLDEIAAWSQMTPEQQRAVLAHLPARRAP